MSEENSSKVLSYIANHWVSWLIEITILCIVAYFTISETRKTAEQTRQMLAKYDAAISQYASEKTKALDSAVGSGLDSAKEKAKNIKTDDVKNFINSFKKEEE